MTASLTIFIFASRLAVVRLRTLESLPTASASSSNRLSAQGSASGGITCVYRKLQPKRFAVSFARRISSVNFRTPWRRPAIVGIVAGLANGLPQAGIGDSILPTAGDRSGGANHPKKFRGCAAVLPYSRLKSYACPSKKSVSRRVVGLPSLSFWNCAKAIGNGPRLAAIAANFPSGTSVAV